MTITAFFGPQTLELNGKSATPYAVEEMQSNFWKRLDFLTHVKFTSKIGSFEIDAIFGNADFERSEFVPFLEDFGGHVGFDMEAGIHGHGA